MDFENYRHFARPPFATSTFSQFADRNLPFTDFRVTRPEMGDYSYIQRGRSHSGREDGLTDGGPARRRISVACARCRKRKIRCSGDPGNGTGCQNCKVAGTDLGQCQFHRVGSVPAASVAQEYYQYGNSIGPGSLLPVYTASPPRSRTLAPYAYSNMNNRFRYPQAWTVPCVDESLESYGLSSPFLPSYSGGAVSADHETSNSNTQAGYALGNMSHLQSALPVTLPERPLRPRQAPETLAPQRQLPIPQPTRTHSSATALDQQQTQALPSSQRIGTSTAGTSVVFARPAIPCSAEASTVDAKTGIATETSAAVPSTASQSRHAPVSNSMPDTMLYVPGAAESASDPMPTTSAVDFSFTAPALFDTSTLSSPVIPNPTYSNLRSSTLSSRPESLGMLPRPSSESDIYSFSPEHMAQRTSAQPGTQAYTSVRQQQPRPANDESPRRNSFNDH